MTTTAFQEDVFQNDAFQIYPLADFAFQQCAFQDDAFQADVCDAIPPVEQPIRNFDYDDYGWARVKRKKEVEEVIQQIALRQSEQLLTDEQKIYDELTRELELKGLEFEAIHLKALNYQRELLINAEIGKLLKLKIQKEDEDILMMFASMVANRMI